VFNTIVYLNINNFMKLRYTILVSHSQY